jgi:hypothetical protein
MGKFSLDIPGGVCNLYYICRPRTRDIAGDDNVDDEEAEKSRWIDIKDLQAGDFQNHGEIILKLLDLAKRKEGSATMVHFGGGNCETAYGNASNEGTKKHMGRKRQL